MLHKIDRGILLCIFFLITFSLQVFSQNHIVIDTISKKPISFATVSSNRFSGTVCDEYGRFKFEGNPADSVEIRCLGYQTKRIRLSKFVDTVYLNPVSIHLNEVMVSDAKPEIVKAGLKRKGMFWSLSAVYQIATLLKPSDEISDAKIKFIQIPIHLFPEKSVETKTPFLTVIKIHIFSNKNNLPDKPLIETPITLYIKKGDKKKILLDLSKEDIYFSKEGVFICIEKVGEVDENGKVLADSSSSMSVVCTDKNSKEFRSQTYIKTKFEDHWKKLNVKEFHLDRELYVAFRLTLEKYTR